MNEITTQEYAGRIDAVYGPYLVQASVHALLISPPQFLCTNVTLVDDASGATVMLPVHMHVLAEWVGRQLRVAAVTEWCENGLIFTTQTVDLDGQRIHQLDTVEDWEKPGLSG